MLRFLEAIQMRSEQFSVSSCSVSPENTSPDELCAGTNYYPHRNHPLSRDHTFQHGLQAHHDKADPLLGYQCRMRFHLIFSNTSLKPRSTWSRAVPERLRKRDHVPPKTAASGLPRMRPAVWAIAVASVHGCQTPIETKLRRELRLWILQFTIFLRPHYKFPNRFS